MSSVTILLIEDNPLTRKIVRKVLAHEDWTLLEACDGASALALLADHRPDLILQDFVLPDIGGVELAEKLRAHPSTAGTPILAFTGFLSKNDEERASAFDGLIAKPIEPSHLVHLVRGHLPSDRSRRTIVGRGRRVVVADDNPTQLKLARFRLSRLGFDVETATDGLEAIAAVRRARPDVVVTDALMPGLDGFGLCRAIRDDPALSAIPIILVTASYVETADRELAQRTGASAFVVRTADLAGVIAALDKVLDARTRLPAPPATPDTPSDSWEAARSVRALQQLERQVSMNNGLMQRCSTLAAELSVLSTVADALVNARNIEGALYEILTNCLDVAGTSRGALCARHEDGSFAIHAQQGFAPEAASELARALEGAAVVAKGHEPLELATVIGADSVGALGVGSGALLIPLNARGAFFGFLLLDAPTDAGEDWRAFAGAIGTQVSLALSLARAFDQVAASEQRSRVLMENAVDAIFVAKDSGIVAEANHAAERLLGLPSSRIVGRDFREFIPADELGVAWDIATHSARHLVRGEGKVPIESSVTSVNIAGERLHLVIMRDVSERNALAAQLRQSQKMEAVGRLAGGVAHDFNNLLSVILSYSEMILDDSALDGALRSDVEQIFQAGRRATDLTSQLLMFSRQQVVEPKVLDLNDVLAGTSKMLRRVLGEDVELVSRPTAGLWRVLVDPGSMDQVIMNLVINARDAMARGGTLTVETANVILDDDYARDHVGAKPGPHVMLAVTDTGSGMDAATCTRIFEPFFTTKPQGKGTGLGLSTVFGIVQQSAGSISVESVVGTGTVFRLYFPRVDAEVEAPSPGGAAVRGTETILLVEDEDLVRTVARGILRRQGYRVLEARDAREAMALAEETKGTIHLLLTDVVMPQTSGPELAKSLVVERPEMKVLYMSGYTDDGVVRHGVLKGDIEFIQKPITPHALTRRVREVLGEPLERA